MCNNAVVLCDVSFPCSICRYLVIPLSQNSGLIGWVPHSDTLHTLIRDYWERKKIMLNVEHRLMLQVRGCGVGGARDVEEVWFSNCQSVSHTLTPPILPTLRCRPTTTACLCCRRWWRLSMHWRALVEMTWPKSFSSRALTLRYIDEVNGHTHTHTRT